MPPALPVSILSELLASQPGVCPGSNIPSRTTAPSAVTRTQAFWPTRAASAMRATTSGVAVGRGVGVIVGGTVGVGNVSRSEVGMTVTAPGEDGEVGVAVMIQRVGVAEGVLVDVGAGPKAGITLAKKSLPPSRPRNHQAAAANAATITSATTQRTQPRLGRVSRSSTSTGTIIDQTRLAHLGDRRLFVGVPAFLAVALQRIVGIEAQVGGVSAQETARHRAARQAGIVALLEAFEVFLADARGLFDIGQAQLFGCARLNQYASKLTHKTVRSSSPHNRCPLYPRRGEKSKRVSKSASKQISEWANQ